MVTLHPSSTAAGDDRATALSAPVRDPLWMLARQWQTGAFIADDAGTPIHTRLAYATTPLVMDGAAITGPLEPLIEAEPSPTPDTMDTATRTQLAGELFRRLRDAGLTRPQTADLRAAFTQAYPLHQVTVDYPLGPLARHLPNTAALLTTLATVLAPDGTGNPFPALPGVTPDIAAAVETAVRGWYAWTQTIITNTSTPSADPTPRHWDPQRLAYTITATTALPAGSLTLHTNDYDGTGLDWYSFDRTTVPITTTATSTPPIEVRPTPISYPGMPQSRFWTLENGNINLDLSLDDPAHVLLAAFAYAYSNDWFVIPLDIPPGACTITQLDVTDTFGTTTTIPATAALEGPTSRWQLWDITPDTPIPNDAAAGVRIHLPASPPALQGPTLEDVLIARDELAHLGWIIELITNDEDGVTTDRYRRWLGLRPPSDPSFNPAEQSLSNSYRLGTTVPDFWYPLCAATTGSAHTLQLAGLPDEATDVPDDGVQGRLIPHQPTTQLADEEASGTGTRLTRVNRLTHTPTGRVVWQARIKQPGTGEASSGLRFDILSTPANRHNLVHNPNFARARRVPPAPLTTRLAQNAAAENWTLWNSVVTTTSTQLEPTTRPDGTGWMLRVSTKAPGCGLVQQWAPNDTGPLHALATAWVYVISGTVSMGCGNGGNTGLDVTSTTTGQWEKLETPSTQIHVNELVIYATSAGGAEYLVDQVIVTAM
jgi:hypothetical protein